MGCVYVLSNPAMPGLVKVGYTEGSAADRARELSSHTGIPVSFFVEYAHEADFPEFLEKEAHKHLNVYRVNPSREFFRVTEQFAQDAINFVVNSSEFRIEVFKIATRNLPGDELIVARKLLDEYRVERGVRQ